MLNTNQMMTITRNFVSELRLAQKGKNSSLSFIRHILERNPTSYKNKFQVLVIGGTVCQKALVLQINHQANILSIKKVPIPIFTTKKDFLKFIFKHYDGTSSRLMLNFAFPMKPITDHGMLDGILLTGTKNHAFSGLINKQIGKSINEFFYEKLSKNIEVCVANDTICLLLSGLKKNTWDQLACGIMGTGTNLAIFATENELVNLESANFNKFSQNVQTKLIDKFSIHPGKGIFEKETAGAYLYQHFNLITNTIGRFQNIHTTEELNNISKNDTKFSFLARQIIQRSAMLLSCQIAGITLYLKKDLIFIMEGSLFWNGWKYKETVEKHLVQLIPKYTVSFEKIPHSQIIGATNLNNFF
jgi:hexokinase